MTIGDKIKYEKLQYDINSKEGKIPTSSPGKIDKYEYLTGEEIFLFNQRQLIHQRNLDIPFSWKSIWKTNKSN